MAANMLAAATTTLGYLAGAKPSVLSTYAIHGATGGSAGSSGRDGERAVRVGMWKVMRGKHRTTGREVSVWVGEKRAAVGGEAVERMKREVSAASRGAEREGAAGNNSASGARMKAPQAKKPDAVAGWSSINLGDAGKNPNEAVVGRPRISRAKRKRCRQGFAERANMTVVAVVGQPRVLPAKRHSATCQGQDSSSEAHTNFEVKGRPRIYRAPKARILERTG